MIFTRLLREQTFSPHFLILSKLFNARFISLEILNVMIIHHVYYAMTQWNVDQLTEIFQLNEE